MNSIEQRKIFLSSEGDKWFHRNKERINKEEKIHNDPIIKIIDDKNISLKNVLEVGCSNGYRLNYLKKIYPSSSFFGIDPSQEAIRNGKKEFKKIHLKVGTADRLNYKEYFFNLVIFGFCLYLCDRKLLSKIVEQTDRVLSKNGFIIIFDFYSAKPYYNKYKHLKGLKSFKMNYSKLFLWNPCFLLKEKKIYYERFNKKKNDNKMALFLIKKIK